RCCTESSAGLLFRPHWPAWPETLARGGNVLPARAPASALRFGRLPGTITGGPLANPLSCSVQPRMGLVVAGPMAARRLAEPRAHEPPPRVLLLWCPQPRPPPLLLRPPAPLPLTPC